MGIYQLKNEELTLEITSAGAEMKSLRDHHTGQEYLWCADEAYWGRTSPVLFPIVGNYKDKTSYFEGKTYTMSQHGFARDMEFELVSQSEEEIWFQLKDNEETRAKYPFHFVLSLGYILTGREVQVLWKVENTDSRKMYFSIGGHPAFNCPLREGEKQTDCRIEFGCDGPLKVSVLNENGVLSDKVKMLELEERKLTITEDLFDDDALIIENNQAHEVALMDSQGHKYLTVSFESPLFGIWSPVGKHASFVCIEPWYGRADRADFNQRLEEREWGNVLNPGEVFEKSYVIRV
ncbi:aldose 1-epimerase family protein [Roseburia hominis]